MTEPLRVAVVGGGPAGFYTIDGLVRGADGPVEVDLLDRLPTPYGLVRAGVAPDHQRIKAVTRAFDKIAAKADVRFHGGVEVGVQVSHAELAERFHAVVYATGAALPRRLGVPGEELTGVVSAAELVPWYNAHPDFAELDPDLAGARAVIIGNGNVAIDVARMLLSDGDELARTDMSDRALARLRASTFTDVAVWGRRGPRQASFSRPELLELISLATNSAVDVVLEGGVDWLDSHLAEPGPALAEDLVTLWREVALRPLTGARRRLVFRFQAIPTAFDGESRVQEVSWQRAELQGESTSTRAVPVGALQREPVDLVVTATGYQTGPIEGVPLADEHGRCAHDKGRLVPGSYVAGWAKRGPSGVIGTNRSDAAETARSVLDDFVAGRLTPPGHHETLEELLLRRGISQVDLAGWQRIDAAESRRGSISGRPRVKFETHQLLQAAAGSG